MEQKEDDFWSWSLDFIWQHFLKYKYEKNILEQVYNLMFDIILTYYLTFFFTDTLKTCKIFLLADLFTNIYWCLQAHQNVIIYTVPFWLLGIYIENRIPIMLKNTSQRTSQHIKYINLM